MEESLLSTEGGSKRDISLGHGEIPELPGRHPADSMTLKRARPAPDQTAEIAEEEDGHILVRVIHGFESFARFNLDSELLAKFPPEALPGVLTALHFSTRELPEESPASGRLSLDHENPLVLQNDPCRDNDDHQFSFAGLEDSQEPRPVDWDLAA